MPNYLVVDHKKVQRKIKAETSVQAQSFVEKKYKVKVVTVVKLPPKAHKPTTKQPAKPATPAPKPAPRLVGPQPPPLCTPDQLDFLDQAIDEVLYKGESRQITLRRIAAAVDYFIQRNQWREAGTNA